MAPQSQSRANNNTLFQFTLEDERIGESVRDCSTGLASASAADAAATSPHLARILAACTPTPGEAKLTAALNAAKAAVLARGDTPVAGDKGSALCAVATELRCRHGLVVRVRHALGGKRKNYLRALRHSFMILPAGVEGNEGTEILLDLNFRDHFVLPWADSEYEALLSALPCDWVGPLDRLAALVAAASSALRAAFRTRGKPLPPWREPCALLSKWTPEWWEDQDVPLVALPQPPAPQLVSVVGAHGKMRAAAEVSASWWGGFAAAKAAAPPPASAVAECLPAPPQLRTMSAPARLVPDVPRKIIVGFPARDQGAVGAEAGRAPPPEVARISVPVVAPAPLAAPAARPGTIAAWAAGIQQAAASAAAAAAAATGSRDRVAATLATASAAPDAASGRAAPRLFKTLDQLLPPVRVVKLGVV